MPTNAAYKKRKDEGVCVWCGVEAYVDPSTLKKYTLCLTHLQASRDRNIAWRRDNPEKHLASKKRDLARRKALRQAGKFRTKRVDAYLQWLFGELRRLRELDAMRDVQP